MAVIPSARPEVDDRVLVAAVRAGDDVAYEELYRRYSRRVAGYVHRMVGDHDRAEDITQEAFFSALRRLRQTDSDIIFKPWIFEIAKNATIDQFRRSSRAEEVSIDPDHGGLRPADHLRLVGGGPGPDAALASKERFDNLKGAFDELSDSHTRILVMRELEGLSYREIGERMELSRPAVESTLFRARRRLNQEYAELDTGARCTAMSAAIDRLSEGSDSTRDRRRVGRHVRRCTVCRRHARELGVSVEIPTRVRERVAAFIPFPVLLRRRRGEGADGGANASTGHAYGASVQQATVSWAPTLAPVGAESTAAAWGKAAAVVAAVALAGGGAAVQERVTKQVGERAGTAPGETSERHGGDHAANTALPVFLSPRGTEEALVKAPGATTAPGGTTRPQDTRSGSERESTSGPRGSEQGVPVGQPSQPGVALPGAPDVDLGGGSDEQGGDDGSSDGGAGDGDTSGGAGTPVGNTLPSPNRGWQPAPPSAPTAPDPPSAPGAPDPSRGAPPPPPASVPPAPDAPATGTAVPPLR
ncbi:MAG TPA: sigma-70 family RNA polymerase sigma factor [Thermoleophilaceae bacterium]|nr:sigma-70 family RNA polymerase sigma factor [Thermoleophilaceae bacterium]